MNYMKITNHHQATEGIIPRQTSNGVNKFSGKKILIFQQRGWGKRIGHFLARQLSQEGAILAALTMKGSAHDFLLNQTEVKYEKIYSVDEVRGNPQKFLGDSHYTLEEICRDLGVDSIWPMAMSLRHHIRSYGDKYYYGFKQNVSDEEIVAYVKAMYKLIVQIFAGFKPEIVITPNFVSLPHLMMDYYAKQKGVKMFGVSDSKVRGIAIFAENQREDRGEFIDRVCELNAGAESENRSKEGREHGSGEEDDNQDMGASFHDPA